MEWISVKEKLPQIKENVLVIYGTKNLKTMTYTVSVSYIRLNGKFKGEKDWTVPYYWMPLPKLPELKTKLDN
jgi:hypothetical protein